VGQRTDGEKVCIYKFYSFKFTVSKEIHHLDATTKTALVFGFIVAALLLLLFGVEAR
jgi:hypothetical protein